MDGKIDIIFDRKMFTPDMWKLSKKINQNNH